MASPSSTQHDFFRRWGSLFSVLCLVDVYADARALAAWVQETHQAGATTGRPMRGSFSLRISVVASVFLSLSCAHCGKPVTADLERHASSKWPLLYPCDILLCMTWSLLNTDSSHTQNYDVVLRQSAAVKQRQVVPYFEVQVHTTAVVALGSTSGNKNSGDTAAAGAAAIAPSNRNCADRREL